MSEVNQLFDLSEKVVLVTGASLGLGAHFAQTLAAAGANLILGARQKDKLDKLKARLESITSVMSVELDVSDTNSVDAAVKAAVEKFGRIDVLVNNAGVAHPQKFVDMSEYAWNEVLDVNLTGVWRVAQKVSRQMLTQENGGCIVNIASVLGLTVQSQQANYCAAKAGVVQLTKSMALELGRKGVRVNSISPGYFKTKMNQDFLESERGKEYVNALFPKRLGQLNELNGALFLLASDAGSYINGTNITVDGGTILKSM